MKLFTIGDSISQGFMSLAAARTELCYSTLLARALGEVPGNDAYPLPSWGAGGLPLNIEDLLRRLQSQYGNDISGPIDWARALMTINDQLDQVEHHYERGPGNIARPQAGSRQWFPNVSVAGFTVADAWIVTPKLCMERIAADRKGAGDGFFALPNMGFERTAHAVLNPSRDPAFNEFSQLEWLRHHHVGGEGVENVALWLGANNALGTIVRMGIAKTDGADDALLKRDLDERNKYNLWSTAHFASEYEELLDRVHDILSAGKCDAKVFIGTIPPVTVAPLARGVGMEDDSLKDPFDILDTSVYFERYTYFLFDLDYARRTSNSLSKLEIYEIDQTIAAYNKTIRKLVKALNKRQARGARKVEYVIVDIAAQLLNLAFKRNRGNPPYVLPDALKELNQRTGRPTNTVYYNVDRQGKMTSGGVFSLDGVHPTAIGHGLIAREFMIEMTKAGVAFKSDIDWTGIVASDSLYSHPISLIPELYDNPRLAEKILDLLRLP